MPRRPRPAEMLEGLLSIFGVYRGFDQNKFEAEPPDSLPVVKTDAGSHGLRLPQVGGSRESPPRATPEVGPVPDRPGGGHPDLAGIPPRDDEAVEERVRLRRLKRRLKAGASLLLAAAAGIFLACVKRGDDRPAQARTPPRPKSPTGRRRRATPAARRPTPAPSNAGARRSTNRNRSHRTPQGYAGARQPARVGRRQDRRSGCRWESPEDGKDFPQKPVCVGLVDDGGVEPKGQRGVVVTRHDDNRNASPAVVLSQGGQ